MSVVLFIISAVLIIDAIGSWRMLGDTQWTAVEETFIWIAITVKFTAAVLIWL